MTIESTYRIYGGELSYFTRKLEAAMIFYGAPFEMLDKNEHDPREIEARSGTHQVPVLQTPENWMIGDTTPLMRLLDDRFPARRMFPKRPLGILVQVVEEYFDEWIARTMVHYRWHYPESAEFASLRMARGVAGYVHDDGELAWKMASPAIASQARFMAMHGKAIDPVSDETREILQKIHASCNMNKHGQHGNDFITSDFAHEFGIYGPPSYCVDRISELAAPGVDRFILAGGPDLAMPQAEIAALARRFMAEVLPKFK